MKMKKATAWGSDLERAKPYMNKYNRYTYLREYLEELGYERGEHSEILAIWSNRSKSYVDKIFAGHSQFPNSEMAIILDELGLQASDENKLKFFPTNGIDLPANRDAEIVVSVLAELVENWGYKR